MTSRPTCDRTTLQNSNMSAEEGRIQRLVREIVSSEIGEPNLPTTVQICQSNREALVNTGGGVRDVFPPTGTVNVLSPRCSLLTQKGKLFTSKLLLVSIHHLIMVEE